MKFLSKMKHKWLILLSVFGPGLITAIADNDAGGVATYSVLGSKFGYSMLFLLLLITVLLAITQEIGARLTIVTGQGLSDLIREYYGVRVSLVIFTLLFIANIGTTIANMAGLKAGLALFHVPQIPFLIAFIILMILFIYKGSYKVNQKLFLTAGLLYITYVISAILAKPDWALATKSLFVPTNITPSFEFLFGSIALLGTTVTPWGQFFISSFIRDKNLTIDKLRYSRFEVYVGAFVTDFFSFFMIVAVAATLHSHGIVINSAEDAALAIIPFAGQFASILFGAGLITASFMGAIIVPLTTAYAFSEFFGVEGSLDLPFNQSKFFYSIFIIQILIAFGMVLLPSVSLFKIVLFTQSLNGVLLPVIIYFLLKFANDNELMGKHVNGRFYNVFTSIFSGIIVIASIVMVIGALLGKI